MASLYKNIQLMLKFCKAPFFVSIFLYINDLPGNVVCNFVIYVDDATLYSKCDKASDLWLLNLNFVYKTLCTGAGSRLLVSIK